jgi:hypothetical protein
MDPIWNVPGPFCLHVLHSDFCCSLFFIIFIIMLSEQIRRVLYMYLDEKEQGKYKKPRKYSQSYCESTPCKWGSLKRRPAVHTKIVIINLPFGVFFLYL